MGLTSETETKTNDDDQCNASPEQKDDIDQDDIRREGYLMKQSIHLKAWRKRYIILREHHLFCYKDDSKSLITEFLNLSSFKKAQLSQKEINRFELIPKNTKDKTRTFSAASISETEEWLNAINQSISAKSEICTHINLEEKAEAHEGIFCSLIFSLQKLHQ